MDPKRSLRVVPGAPEYTKTSIRTNVDHPFDMVKNLFFLRNTLDKGLIKHIAHMIMFSS